MELSTSVSRVSLPLSRAELAGGGDALSFGDGEGCAGGDGGETIDLAAGPADFDGIGFVARAEAEGQDQFAGRKIAGAAAEHFRLGIAASGELYDSADAVAVGLGADQFETQAVIPSHGALGVFFGQFASTQFIAE